MAGLRKVAFAVLCGLFVPTPAAHANPGVDALARDVTNAESIRAVKALQRLYAQYAQYGLWNDVGGLFAAGATFTFDGQVTRGKTVTGNAAIAGFLRKRYGGGHDGLRSGDVRTWMMGAPLVSLSTNGQSARGRWYILIFKGGEGSAGIEGGTFVNDYIRENGIWKIAAAHYHPQFDGPYETGWANWGGGDLPIVPYHFTSDTAGAPIPPQTSAAPLSKVGLAALGRRITRLNAEDQVRNLQGAYGYYADRKMWDDVVDLFSRDGIIEIGGIGLYRGQAGVRRWLETMGPQGLRHGQLHDRPQFNLTVAIASGGNEAFVRGVELGMLGEADEEKGWWEVAVFRNRFVREAGVWKIREMRRFPLFKTDYYQGWAKSRIVEPVPAGDHAPDAPVPVEDRAALDLATPAFLERHPVTGRPVAPLGEGRAVAGNALTGEIPAERHADVSLDEARRRLAVSLAYDGVENVSSAYTYYLDDYQSHQFGALLAEKGFKMSAFAGYYVGRDRVTEAGVRVWGKPPVTRPGIHFHWRPQPVIMVAPDGRSANLRTRLFQPRTGKTVGGAGDWYAAAFTTGMYHDQFVLENGVWRFWNLSLDEPYAVTVGWKDGWARAKDPKEPARGPASALLRNDEFMPDVPVTALGERQRHFRGGTGDPWQWPTILPMWFEYTNPVSGRVPEHYQKYCAPCDAAPQLRLDQNGFMLPPDLKDANSQP
jgi:hypothetical protein